MEGQLWVLIVAILPSISKRRKRTREDFSDEDIVKVFYWSVIHDRPVSWACQRRNWPLYLRRQKLPSNTTMSRRLRTASVVALLDALERRVTSPCRPHLYWMIDGKPLVVSGCSKDRQAGYGRAARSKAKGYKIHAIIAADGSLANWRLAPMNKDERVMALLALVNDLGERRDRAAPSLERGKARELPRVQRQEPIQLLDESARNRGHGLSLPRSRASEPQPSCRPLHVRSERRPLP